MSQKLSLGWVIALIQVQKLAIIIQSLNEWVSKSKIEQIRPQTTLNQIGVLSVQFKTNKNEEKNTNIRFEK